MKKILAVILLTFLVTNFSYSQCTPIFNFYQYSCDFDCGLYIDNMPIDNNINYDQAVLWDFGDGNFETGNYFATQHQYAGAGTYLITAEILVGECEGMLYTYEFTTEMCNCPTDLTSELFDNGWSENYSTQCSSYEFTFGGDDFVFFGGDTNTNVQWDFGDGSYTTSYSSTYYHSFESEGEFIVSATFTNDYCGQITLVDTVDVAFCDGNCAPFEYFDYYQIPGNCNNVNLVLDFNPNTMWYVDGDYVGQGYIVETFLEAGYHEVCMVIEPQAGCPFGSEFCTEIFIDCETDCPTQEDFYAENFDDICNYWEFEIGDNSGYDYVIWDFGDGNFETGGHYTTHNYAENGDYLVTATYYSSNCPDGIIELSTLAIVDCIEDCSIYVGVYEGDCYVDLIAETNALGSIEWYVDGNLFEYGPIITVDSPGYHSYCAVFSSDDCNYTIEYCGDFVVGCNTECPTYNNVFSWNNEFECNLWDFEITGDYEGEFVWNFNDGTIATGSNFVSHEFEENGFHLVEVSYVSDDCPDGVWFQIEVFVNCIVCWVDIEAIQNDCDTYTFISHNNPDDEFNTISWFLDGEYLYTGEVLEYTFTEGSHTICVVSESGFCYEEMCLDLEIEDCNDCTTIDFAIDSNVNQGGPEVINWMVYNLEDGSIGESGVCDFDEQNMYCDPSLCFPDGCYQMVFFIEEGFDWTGITSFPSIDGNPLNIYNISSDCNCGILTYDFSINGDCVEEECYLDIQTEMFNEDVFGFSANAPDDAIVFWTMGDGTTLTGNVINYEYDSPGTYEVCAFYETPNCPLGVESCTTIIVEETSCTELTISISASIDELQMELIQFYLMNEEFEFEGEIPFTSLNGSLEMTYCIPDGCYNFTLVPSDGLFDLIDLSIEASINGVIVGSLEDIIGTEPVSLLIPVNTNCTLAINEEESIGFDLFPNPASETIQIMIPNTNYDIIKIYNSIGELVLSEEITMDKHVVDVGSLSNGLYQVTLSNNSVIETKNLIINR